MHKFELFKEDPENRDLYMKRVISFGWGLWSQSFSDFLGTKLQSCVGDNRSFALTPLLPWACPLPRLIWLRCQETLSTKVCHLEPTFVGWHHICVHSRLMVILTWPSSSSLAADIYLYKEPPEHCTLHGKTLMSWHLTEWAQNRRTTYTKCWSVF